MGQAQVIGAAQGWPIQACDCRDNVKGEHFPEEEYVHCSARDRAYTHPDKPIQDELVAQEKSLDPPMVRPLGRSSSHDMSTAKTRLKGAIEAVKAVNRMAKTVHFSEAETVVCYEVKSEGSVPPKGFAIGDEVYWADCDNDVPKGSVGDVVGFGAGDLVQVKFPKGTWDFRAAELTTQDSWAMGVVRLAITKAEKQMRNYEVLAAEAILSEAAGKLSEAVLLEKFEDVREVSAENFEQFSVLVASDNEVAEPASSQSGKKLGSKGRRVDRVANSNSGTRSPGTRRASALSQSEAAEARLAINRLREHPVYRETCQRVGQYQAISRALQNEGFDLRHQTNNAQFWVRIPFDASWMEYRFACDFNDASLVQCVSTSYEEELKLTKSSSSTYNAKTIQDCMINLLARRIELTVEKYKWINTEYGFFAESLRWPFYHSATPRLRHRLKFNAVQLWIPHGGSNKGTLAIHFGRIDLGSRIARWALCSFCAKAIHSIAEDIEASIRRAKDPATNIMDRIRNDRTGFYGRLRQAETAAARRKPVSKSCFPSPEIVRRAQPLSTGWP